MRLDYQADGTLSAAKRYPDATRTNLVVQTNYSLDSAGRLTNVAHTRPVPAGNLPVSYAYRYFADGRLLDEVSPVDGTTSQGYDAFGQVTATTRTAGTQAGANESFAYDAMGNRTSAATVVGKGNRILDDGTFTYVYDAEGNLTRRTTISDQSFLLYTWDHRSRLTKVEAFTVQQAGPGQTYNVPTKVVEYSYDDANHRISKKVTPLSGGGSAVSEFTIWDGDQAVAVLNASGSITHQIFDGPSLDQVFADQTTVNGILWPLEDQNGNVRDVINSAGGILDHRVLSSFGAITSRTNAAIDFRGFQSGMVWDADSQLYYASPGNKNTRLTHFEREQKRSAVFFQASQCCCRAVAVRPVQLFEWF